MKEKSAIFERGQVWYWEDPIYARKGPNSNFQIGEATIRYSRYVIIVQTPDTIDNCCCLVVPCSTGNHTPHDVPIPMEHLYHNQLSYAKCRTLMPVHPKMLSRYICKIPDEILAQIDAEIIRLLCPYITKTFSSSDIKEWFGIDMEAEHLTKEMIEQNHEFDGWVNAFVERELILTGDVNDKVNVHTMKAAFDVFCINSHSAPVTQDTFRFMDSIVKILTAKGAMSIGNWNDLSVEIVNMSSFAGVKLKDDSVKVSFTLSRNIGEPNRNGTTFSQEAITKVFTPAKNNWKDIDHIRTFVTYYEDHGLEECAKHFNLGQNTAKRYYSKFVSSGYTALPKEIKLPTAKDSPRSVSKISNMIRTYLLGRKTHKASKNLPMAEDEYYARIQSACYFSILEFMGIRVNGHKSYIPTLSAKTEHLDTWRFFDRVYHDKRISMENDPVEMMRLGRQYFGDSFGISPDWIPMIRKRLEKTSLNAIQIDTIVTAIIELFVAK